MNRREFIQYTGCSILGTFFIPSCQRQDRYPPTNGKFILWQLPSQTPSQMNSYILQTGHRKIIVIDGGNAGDAPYLRGFLAACGNQVEAWFISHPHPDHVDALTVLLNNPGDLTIGNIYGSLPEANWIANYEPAYLTSLTEFHFALQKSAKEITELTIGQILRIDGVCIEILAIKNPEITNNAINNSSLVMKVSDRRKSVLFTGDLGVEGGKKMLQSSYGDQLHADYVQMAHHGQNGVNERFYQAVAPNYCLWPTPLWLWDCDNGGGKGSGPWDTLHVRAWMDRLNIQKHYVSGYGLCKIE
jgi:beta-lactamase superfamily II metal-dependent hydrolase